jgi:hypothetical protein
VGPRNVLLELQVAPPEMVSHKKSLRPQCNPFNLFGAQERTRTSTPLRELAPEASASANSATWAIPAAKQRGPSILPRDLGFVNEAHPRCGNLDLCTCAV